VVTPFALGFGRPDQR